MRILVGAIVWMLAAPAAADSYDYADDNPWHRAKLELSGTIGQRRAQIGGVSQGWREAAIAIARRKARRTTEVAYGFGVLDGGIAHELAIRQRHSLVVIGGYSDSLRRGDGWVELGAAAELLDRVSRPALSLGFGADLDFGNATYDGSTLRYLGARLAVRLTAAPAPSPMTACAGSCGAPSWRDRIDLGIVVSASVVMGR